MSDEEKDARQGWRARRRGSRERISRRQSPEDRALANAARSEILSNLREQRELNSDGGDMIANLSDEDLWALYQQHMGKKAGKNAKRPAIEAAVREAIAAEAEAAAKAAEDDKELGRDMFADGDEIPEDVPENANIRAGWIEAEAEANQGNGAGDEDDRIEDDA